MRPASLASLQLLVTLLLWNAVAMEALPVFLDKLLTPYSAIIISVTMVLLFGAPFCTHCFLISARPVSCFVRALSLPRHVPPQARLCLRLSVRSTGFL